MKINTTRAGKILGGVSKAVVRKLVETGRLTDYATTKDGGQRHEFKLERAEVKAFAATHVRQGRSWLKISKDTTTPVQKRTYTKKTVVAETVEQPKAKVMTGGEGLLARIQRLEKEIFG